MTRRLEKAAAAVLASVTVLSPLFLGGTPVWARFGIEAGMAVAAVLWAVARRRRWATVFPVLAIAAVLLSQTVELPQGVLRGIAPVSSRAWSTVNAETRTSRSCVSVDPHATAVAVQRALLGLATIAVVAHLGSDVRLRGTLSGALAASAIVMWWLGVALPTSRKDGRTVLGFIDLAGPLDFWLTPLKHPIETAAFGYPQWVVVGTQRYRTCDWGIGDGFGPYIITNHFAGGFTLTLPLVLAAWFSLTRGRLSDWVRLPIAVTTILAAVWTTAVLADSRAGAASLLMAGLTVLALCLHSRWLRIGATGIMAAYAVALCGFLVIFFGRIQGATAMFPESLRPAVSGLLSDPRTIATAAAMQIFRGSPIIGTGLSTFALMFPDAAQHPTILYYAHNDYAQMLAETGSLGLGLILCAALVLGSRFLRFAKASWQSHRDLEAGPWAALVGFSLHTALDWNLHVPANAFLACVVAGLALANSSAEGHAASDEDSPIAPRNRIPGGLLALACLAAVAILCRDAYSGQALGRLRQSLTAARMTESHLSIPTSWPDLATAVADAEQAMDWDPANPHLSLLLGQAWLHQANAPQPIDDVSSCLQAADVSFRRARINLAAGWGFPEPLPDSTP